MPGVQWVRNVVTSGEAGGGEVEGDVIGGEVEVAGGQ